MNDFYNFIKWCFRDDDAGLATIFVIMCIAYAISIAVRGDK